MSYSDEEIEFTDGFEESEQNIIDQAAVNNPQTPIPSGGEQISAQSTAEPTVPEYSLQEKYERAFSAAKSPEEHDALVEMFRAELNAKQAMQLSLGMDENGTPLSGNALFNSIKSGNFPGDPKVAKSFADKVQYNLQTDLGPSSIVDVDSVLTDWEADNGYYLSPDDFGIYRKFKNGIMDADDAYKVSILDGAYEKAVHDAFTELMVSSSDILPKTEVQGNSTTVPPATTSNPSMDIKTDSSYGPGLSDAIKQGLVLDSSGRIVVGSGGNNGSDLVYRGGNIQAQSMHWEGARDGRWTLVFSSEGNYGTVTLYDENKNVIFLCDATSGRIGETNRSKEYEGPIRFGSYTLDPKDISGGLGKAIERNIIRREDWGFYRVPLKPQEGTDMGIRGEFFLHGGFFPGSAGCIDIGTNDRVLFPLLMQHEGIINVEVIQRKRYDILFPNSPNTYI